MNKKEFIDKIILRHSANLNSEQTIALQEDYTLTLEDNIDFDALFSSYLQEYNYNVAPKPAWFVQRAKKRVIQRSGTTEIRDLLVVLENGTPYQFAYEYPLETEQQAIEGIKFRLKDKKYRLYRIVKIDEGDNGIRREKQEIYI